MKRNLTLMASLFVAFFMFACSKDNKNEESTNPFIGTWALESYVHNDVDETTDCERKERAVFTDKTIDITFHYVKPADGSCVSVLENFTYSYSENKATNVKEQKTGEVIDDFMTFVIVNGKLIITQVDDNSKTVSTYKKQ